MFSLKSRGLFKVSDIVIAELGLQIIASFSRSFFSGISNSVVFNGVGVTGSEVLQLSDGVVLAGMLDEMGVMLDSDVTTGTVDCSVREEAGAHASSAPEVAGVPEEVEEVKLCVSACSIKLKKTKNK